MLDCNCLVHPFQNSPGTSQHQRVMDALLAGSAKIDGRTLADLLGYFQQLARHINYYDNTLNVSDWQPFFEKSIPFTLAAAINYTPEKINADFELYNLLFKKRPGITGLQLQAYFIFYRIIHKINQWHKAVENSGLPAEREIELLIKDKLQQPVKKFIAYTNAASQHFGIQRIEFLKLYQNKVWNLSLEDLYKTDTAYKENTFGRTKQLTKLHGRFNEIFPSFISAIKALSAHAEASLEQSFLPLKAALQKEHPPHLGLLFAFLNMFRQLQDDLNGFTKKHLDFFYKDVLQVKPGEAVADKAHILFEIQKQLQKYLVRKGTLAKDGKDNNKQEILFSLDDDIVANKAEVAEVKTLFLNNQTAFAQTYTEGVYIAPDATKADGIKLDFTNGEPANFFTVGNKLSKYTNPETKIIQPHPNARLGFILASPVLYLQEGTRTVDITLACELKNAVCNEPAEPGILSAKNCCNPGAAAKEESEYPNFFSANTFYDEVNKVLNETYYYISQDLIKEAVKNGISVKLADRLKEAFLKDTEPPLCYCPVEKIKFDATVTKAVYDTKTSSFTEAEHLILANIIKPRRAFSVLFSGEKEWIEALPFIETTTIQLEPAAYASNKFILRIKTTLNPDKPAVTFYDKEKLKEDFGTTQPLVKIELDDKIKLVFSQTEMAVHAAGNIKLNGESAQPGKNEDCCVPGKDCCLSIENEKEQYEVSLYHFFRNLRIINKIGTDPKILTDETRIDVQVCGLKNFIVQNDEGPQDVNGIIAPFGSIPRLGSNFYISSKEIFCKNWTDFNLKFNWKDKPAFLKEYYHGYEDVLSTPQIKTNDFDEDHFLIEYFIIENGVWKPVVINSKKLFSSDALGFCDAGNENQKYKFTRTDFVIDDYQPKNSNCFKKEIFSNSTRNGFLKLTLRNNKNLDFQHDRYSFVLTRQMMALGKFPDIYVGPVYDGINPAGATTLPVMTFDEMFDAIKRSFELTTNVRDRLDIILPIIAGAHVVNDNNSMLPHSPFYDAAMWNPHYNSPHIPFPPNPFPIQEPVPDNSPHLNIYSLKDIEDYLEDSVLKPIYDKIEGVKQIRVVIPKQPYTPKLQGITLDYNAAAVINDIDFIHLYPFANTYKNEEIELQPTLFPTCCDEGSLFLGLKELVPGNNLNMLFQLAEATSDSESEKEEVHWHYLDSNVWKPLRKGFEVLDDATENLTTSGIIKFALPANFTKDNTVMPKELHWIKATIAKNSKAVSETTGIHTQAIQVVFTNEKANDKLRLSQPLPAGSIAKLNTADTNIKGIKQPYDSFNGRLPEMEGQYYVRVSELLRHKGRAIQKFDYERLVLEAFPQVFKAKCINHSFALDAHRYINDFPYAPGYVILALIPDLYQMKAGNSFEPKVPVSLIEKIEAFIRRRTSPFVRFRAMNPRYEKINICLRVKLLPGKEENYYREKLKEDLRNFLAPWAVGEYSKLTFGQCIYRSDIIRFLETKDYVDFINDCKMGKESEPPAGANSKVCPDTPRSILIAGNIEVCIEPPECEKWQKCYNQNQEEEECCNNELIPIIDYCGKSKMPADENTNTPIG